MSRKNTAPEVPTIAVGETRAFSVSFVGVLDSGELLTGTPTITEETTTDLTITNKVVSTETLVINGKQVAAYRAVQFSLSGQLESGSPYRIKIQVTSDSTPPQSFVKYVRFKVDDQ